MPESVLFKSLTKRVQRRRTNRLGSVEGDLPRRKIDAFEFFVANFVDAQLVGEVRATADRDLMTGDRLQPTTRSLQKRHRAHQNVVTSDKHRHQHTANQTHVVVSRQPRRTNDGRLGFKPVQDQLTIGDQVGLRQHHTLR